MGFIFFFWVNRFVGGVFVELYFFVCNLLGVMGVVKIKKGCFYF